VESFSYVSVLLSIVLGLAITQVLQGFRGLILTRAKVKLYGLAVLALYNAAVRAAVAGSCFERVIFAG